MNKPAEHEKLSKKVLKQLWELEKNYDIPAKAWLVLLWVAQLEDEIKNFELIDLLCYEKFSTLNDKLHWAQYLSTYFKSYAQALEFYRALRFNSPWKSIMKDITDNLFNLEINNLNRFDQVLQFYHRCINWEKKEVLLEKIFSLATTYEEFLLVYKETHPNSKIRIKCNEKMEELINKKFDNEISILTLKKLYKNAPDWSKIKEFLCEKLILDLHKKVINTINIDDLISMLESDTQIIHITGYDSYIDEMYAHYDKVILEKLSELTVFNNVLNLYNLLTFRSNIHHVFAERFLEYATDYEKTIYIINKIKWKPWTAEYVNQLIGKALEFAKTYKEVKDVYELSVDWSIEKQLCLAKYSEIIESSIKDQDNNVDLLYFCVSAPEWSEIQMKILDQIVKLYWVKYIEDRMGNEYKPLIIYRIAHMSKNLEIQQNPKTDIINESKKWLLWVFSWLINILGSKK